MLNKKNDTKIPEKKINRQKQQKKTIIKYANLNNLFKMFLFIFVALFSIGYKVM